MTDARFQPRTKGRLTPRAESRMTRLAPEPALRELVQQWWLPQWEVPAGTVREEHVLGYPVCNLVAEAGAVRLYGPTTRAAVRRLERRGWAVGALLTSAAGRHLADRPLRELVDRSVPVAAGPGARLDTIDGARRALVDILVGIADRVDADDRDALRLTATIDQGGITTVGELAAALHLSARSVQRLALRNTGLGPAALIRRRRLQEAAAEVRARPDRPLAEVAAAHGFADHAHLTREFARVLGFTPSTYRAGRV